MSLKRLIVFLLVASMIFVVSCQKKETTSPKSNDDGSKTAAQPMNWFPKVMIW